MRKFKRLIGLVSACGFACVCLLALAQEPKGESAGSVKPPTIEQLYELGYWLLHCSNINVVNGINLTREQAVALREMAVELAAMGDEPVKADFANAPELAEVRDGFKELSELLIQNKPVSDELRATILTLRTTEAGAIRAGLVLPPRQNFRYGECGRCHIVPGESLSGSSDSPSAGELEFMSVAAKAESGTAHSLLTHDGKVLRKVAMMGKRIDSLLSDQQKSIFGSFSCCLIPPRGMSDPVLAGQAASGDWEIDLLRKVRNAPEKSYPTMKRSIIAMVAHYAVVKDPSITEADKKEMAERIGEALDKARSLSESDFELTKEELVAGLHDKKRADLTAEKRVFSQAYFLLQPGSVAVYDEFIKRLDNPSAVERPDTAPNGTEKPT